LCHQTIFPQIEGTTAAEKAAELFTQEASALEQLDDRHIPKLLAYFIMPDGRQYLVQEFINGQNLKQELELNGVFSTAQIRELLMAMLSTLEYIYQLGFIHRDIKPENIIRQADDRQLHLVDFGAAKIATANSSQLPGTKIGTPEFMAPEQGWGKAFPASDLYSLGTTCLNLLTGISPFDLFDDNRGEWSWRGTLGQPIDPNLAAVIDKLIQPKPIDRYATARDALSALQDNIAIQNLVTQQVTNTESNPIQSIAIEVGKTNSVNTSTAIKSAPPAIVNGDQKWECIYLFQWHNKPINTIAIFTNGQYLISGDDGGTVAIWNLTMPQQPMATYRTNNSIWTVAASPNYSQIASGDKNRKIQLRRKESIGNSIQELHGDFSNLDSHNGSVYTVQFSPDGKILASGGADRKIRLWNTDTSKIIYTLDGHQDAVTALQFMPNGKIIISAGADCTIRFWDLEHKHKADLLPLVQLFQHRLNQTPLDVADRLWVKSHLEPTEEKLQVSS
jgi:serine/threonine protein kinase